MNEKKAEKFFALGPASDESYTFNRNSESREDVRQFVEALWSKFRPLSGDPHFRVIRGPMAVPKVTPPTIRPPQDARTERGEVTSAPERV